MRKIVSGIFIVLGEVFIVFSALLDSNGETIRYKLMDYGAGLLGILLCGIGLKIIGD
ncbi:MAG: hypothetical protein H0Z16_03170 [Thermodesulfobacterium sp.]|nr:hypothetical protein [Thermodesulfobacterium sp.]